MTDDANPFLSESTLPYGLPDFAAIRDGDYLPAFEAGFRDHLEEIAAITADPAPADFANTAEAMERSGQQLRRVSLAFYNITSSHGTPALLALEEIVAPQLAKHTDNIYLDQQLYSRFQQVPDTDLPPESARLLEEYLKAFRRAGAQLDAGAQSRMRAINAELSELETTFGQRVVKGINASALLLDDAAGLDGLSADEIATAARAATDAGHEGKYLLTLILPSAQPALAVLRDREVRRRLHQASLSRGSAGDELDVLPVAAAMAALRAEKAALLGFATYADFATDDQTAPSVEAIHSLLGALAPAAVRNARAEAVLLEQNAGHSIEPWDWAFYSEAVRREKYSVDSAALKPYFELDRVLTDGIFYAANRLYGLSFTLRDDLAGYHPDVRAWEVTDATGRGLGLFLGDYHTRDTKRGGAWMNPLVEQSQLLGMPAVVVNNLNISKPAPGEPTLLTIDEVRTCFHEFGHALHGLLSDVRYPRFSGPSVARDFVEYPSQVNEMWMLWDEVVTNYARHYKTGEPLDPATIARLEDSRLWGEGFATTAYLGAALLDLAWHELEPGSTVEDPLAFEVAA
ncbi:MAG TPA: M3 family metallopeptidase, partial [Micrococcaceae bacterium]